MLCSVVWLERSRVLCWSPLPASQAMRVWMERQWWGGLLRDNKKILRICGSLSRSQTQWELSQSLPAQRGQQKEAHQHQLYSWGPLQDSLPASDLKEMPAEILVVKRECVRGQLSSRPKEGYEMDGSSDPVSPATLRAPDRWVCHVFWLQGLPGAWHRASSPKTMTTKLLEMLTFHVHKVKSKFLHTWSASLVLALS